MHGATYEDHPVAAAAALQVQQIIESEGLVENARVQGERMLARLQERIGSHPCVCHIRGRGLFCGVSTKFPLPSDLFTNILRAGRACPAAQ